MTPTILKVLQESVQEGHRCATPTYRAKGYRRSVSEVNRAWWAGVQVANNSLTFLHPVKHDASQRCATKEVRDLLLVRRSSWDQS